MKFCIQMANIPIEINSLYPYAYHFCKDYLIENILPELSITITTNDIDFERNKSDREAVIEGKKTVNYSNEYLETLAIYRKIVEELIDRDIILFHGSVVAVGNEAVLFTAKSGTGKTTHTNLWLNNIPNSYMVNGDKPLLIVKDDKIYACGTPWSGKEKLNKNVIVPLKAICVLDRGIDNIINEMKFDDALPYLMAQSYRPKNTKKLLKVMSLLNKFNQNLTLYHIWCNMTVEACLVSYSKIFRKGDIYHEKI